MKKVVLFLVVVLLIASCIPKAKVEVATSIPIVKVDTTAIDRERSEASKNYNKLTSMIAETKDLVYASKKIGKTDLVSELASSIVKFDNFNQLVNTAKYKEANDLAGIIYAELSMIQLTVSEASQSGKKK